MVIPPLAETVSHVSFHSYRTSAPRFRKWSPSMEYGMRIKKQNALPDRSCMTRGNGGL